MITLNAEGLDHKALNEALRRAEGPCRLTGCLGQRFIGAGMSHKEILIDGIPGNALGAYLNGARMEESWCAEASATPPDTPCGAERSL